MRTAPGSKVFEGPTFASTLPVSKAPAKSLARPTVAVVLCTWRAGEHFERQLDSLDAQSWPAHVHVFDDHSGDSTATRARAHPVVHRVIEKARNRGFVANFETGLAQVLALGYDYIAFCDQDDHWHPERLSAGMAELLVTERQSSNDTPVLVHSDLRLIDSDDRELHASFLAWRGYATDKTRNLAVMLGQCGVMGNTILMNRALAKLTLPFPPDLFVHDWWTGLLAELWGQRVFLPQATVDYRLHASNTCNTLERSRRGVLATLDSMDMRAFLKADLRLPFLEDRRVEALEHLLAGDAHRPALGDDAQRTIEHFVDYLRLRGSRTALLRETLRRGYIKRGLIYRLRFSLALLWTRRYSSADR